MTAFPYKPDDHEAETASNSYLMSLVAVIAGLPIPVLNLFATFFFYLGNQKGTYFTRWHCTQALISQLSLLLINSYAFWQTVSIIFTDEKVNNHYFSYLFAVIIFNLIEFIVTIYTAIETRKGRHIKWWFYGPLTDILCKTR